MKLTDAELAAIRASDERDRDREFVHYAQRDRHALLAHIEALEVELDEERRDHNNCRHNRKANLDSLKRVEARIAELEAALADAGMPCSAWDSRCTQYAQLLCRASFLMQTASAGDVDMRKFISEVERLVGSAALAAAPTEDKSHD